MAQNVLARTFELRFFLSLLYFFSCRVWDFRPALPLFFWSFESSFFTVLAIVIRRLLYVPDYVVGSLNSLFIWSLSLQLVQYNSQRSAETRDATGLKSLPSTIQRIGKMADEELKKKKKIRGGHKGYGTITLEKVQALLDDFELSVANQVKTYRIAITEKLNILSALDEEILTLITEEHSEDEISETGIFRESIHEMIVRIDETL